MTDASLSSTNMDLHSFSFRWHLGLDCEDEDESVSDYGIVLHTEANLSAPLTAATGLSAVEETTEGALTDSRTGTTRRLSSTMPPSNNGLDLSPSQDRKDFGVAKISKNILDRLWSASDRLVPRLSTPVPVPTSPVTRVQVDSSRKPSAAPRPRPKNKLRKKTRPSIALTLAVEPTSSLSLAQPLPRSLEILQTSTSPVSVSPVAGFPSARSFLSFQFPPVFSRARSKLLQKSTYRPSNDVGIINRSSTTGRPGVDSSGIWTRKSRGRVSRDTPAANHGKRTVLIGENGIGGFPTPVEPAGHHRRRGGSREGTPVHGRPNRISTPWELGLGLGQNLRLGFCNIWHVRGG